MEKLNFLPQEQEGKRENWLNNTINGRLANKLKVIWKEKGKKVSLVKDDYTGNYLNKFFYDGKEISARSKIHGVEVGDYGWWTVEHFVSLSDLSQCSDLLKAILEVEEERGFKFSINDTILFNDCLKLIWENNFLDIFWIIKREWIKKFDLMNELIEKAIKEINSILEPSFTLWINRMSYNLFIKTNNESAKQEIITSSQDFIDKIIKVKTYLDQFLYDNLWKVDPWSIWNKGLDNNSDNNQINYLYKKLGVV